MQHKGAPSKRKAKLPRVPTWTCPHCAQAHTPATLQRLDNDHMKCARCGKPFPVTQAQHRVISVVEGEQRTKACSRQLWVGLLQLSPMRELRAAPVDGPCSHSASKFATAQVQVELDLVASRGVRIAQVRR